MSYVQIADLLRNLRDFHAAMSRYYQMFEEDGLVGEDARGRIHEILRVARDHEKRLATTLDTVKKIADDGAARTWLQFEPDRELWRIAEQDFAPECDRRPEQAFALALEVDQALLRVYETVASSGVPPRVRSLFEELARMQQSGMRRRALENLDKDI